MVYGENEVELNFDLWKPTVWHLKFLDKVNSYPHLLEEPLLSESLWRYEFLWLPLVAKHSDELLVAPLDVEFVWICHMLSPQEYENDCKKLYNRVLNHEVLSPEEREKELWPTKDLWESVYPNVPFVIHKLKDLDDFRKKSHPTSQFACHLSQAVQHQWLFSYQVALPHYKDKTFIEHSVDRYKKYLYLHKDQGLQQTPSFDINLIWHVHMLHPLAYKVDSVRLFGALLDHEVTISMLTGSKLYDTEAPIRTMWKEIFSEKYNRGGSSFRGPRPNKRLQKLTPSDRLSYSTMKAMMTFTSMTIQGLPSNNKTIGVCLNVRTRHRYQYGEFELDDKIFSVKGNQREWKGHNLGQFNVDTVFRSFLSICLKEKSKTNFLKGSSKILGENQSFCLDKVLKSLSADSKTPFSIDIPMTKNKEIVVTLSGVINVPQCGMSVFFLSKGSYHHNVNPDSQEQLWGPVPLPYLKPRTKTNCVVASHRLQNHDKEVKAVFTARIIHSLPLVMSAVQIYYKDKLTVISHLIDHDQLPKPFMVGQKMRCITLDPNRQERAMVIKNHKGDWAILVGRWEDDGYLRVKFYRAPFTQGREVISLESSFLWKRDFEVKVRNMTMHFDRGTVEIYETTDEVAEHLALAFSIAVLQTLCQPRPKDWKPITKKEAKGASTKVEGNTISQMGLILAAGFLVLTPSNTFLNDNKKLESLASIDEEEEENMEDDEEPLSIWGNQKKEEESPDPLYSNLLDNERLSPDDIKLSPNSSTSEAEVLSDDTNVMSDDTHVVSDGEHTDIQGVNDIEDQGPISIDMVDNAVEKNDGSVMSSDEGIHIDEPDRPDSRNDILTIDNFDEGDSRTTSPCFRNETPELPEEPKPHFFIDNFSREQEEIQQDMHVAAHVHENGYEDDNAFSEFMDGYRNSGSSRYSERRDSSSFVSGGFGDNACGFGSVSSSGNLGGFGDNTRGFADSAGSYGDNRDGLSDGFL